LCDLSFRRILRQGPVEVLKEREESRHLPSNLGMSPDSACARSV